MKLASLPKDNKEMCFPLVFDAQLGNLSVFDLIPASPMYATFHMPSDLGTIVSLDLIVIPGQTEVAQIVDFYWNYGTVGEAYNLNTGSDTGNSYSVTLDQIFAIDLTALTGFASGLAAGDIVGLQADLQNAGDSLFGVGIKMVYTPA